ncbi:hypothetical protein ACFL3S_07270 [Gemmatimonadota bacterium]
MAVRGALPAGLLRVEVPAGGQTGEGSRLGDREGCPSRPGPGCRGRRPFPGEGVAGAGARGRVVRRHRKRGQQSRGGDGVHHRRSSAGCGTPGRHEELLELLEEAPYVWWPYRQYGVRALVSLGRKAEALRYAEASRERDGAPGPISRACEEILLSSGLAEEAYGRYAIEANRRSTYLATFRAIAGKYPALPPERILRDLADSTPGEEGKWFAAAKDAGLFDLAAQLASQSPCDPRTLTRAARDFSQENPAFAIEAGIAALGWLVEGYGYEVTNLDVLKAYRETMKAAENAGRREEIQDRIRALVKTETVGERFVTRALGEELGLE